jgi:hypothetical protein
MAWRRPSLARPAHQQPVARLIGDQEAADDHATPAAPFIVDNFGTCPGRLGVQIVDNFSGHVFARQKRAFLPFRKAKTALALAPEGVKSQNVKMGKTKCARFFAFFDPILTPF